MKRLLANGLSISTSICICPESTKRNMAITYNGQDSETTMVRNTAVKNDREKRSPQTR